MGDAKFAVKNYLGFNEVVTKTLKRHNFIFLQIFS